MSLELRVKRINRQTPLLIILFGYCILFAADISSASSSGDIREGNRLYKQEKYGEAADKYNQALKQSPDSDIAHFNLGDALYKKGQYKEAIDAFTKALSTDNKSIEAKAFYNLANSKYKLGSQAADSDLNSAISMYREALDYYKRAMEMKEGDKDAEYNHELVEKKLKALLDRQKNRQNQDKNKDNDQGKKDKQDGKQSQGKSEQQKEEEKQQAGQQNKQDTKSQQADAKEDKGKAALKDEIKGTPPSGPGKDKEGMTPEEARMLLDAYGQEGTINDKHEIRGHSGEVLKDW